MMDSIVLLICSGVIVWRLIELFTSKTPIKIYEAIHCPCIYESAYYTISTHRTKKGAEKAIKEHRKGYLPNYESIKELHQYENWRVSETELLD